MCCFPLGLYILPLFMLITPSIIMEDLGVKAAFKRSRELVHRSFLTSLAIALLMFIVPAVIGGAIGVASIAITRQLEFYEKVENGEAIESKDGERINIGPGGVKIDQKVDEKEKDKLTDEERQARRVRGVQRETTSKVIMGLLMTPIMILITSLASVIMALMYFKTRQAGGESMQGLLAKFEDAEHPQSKWQHRIKDRLVQSGRISSVERK